jgi:hypothetical protein
MKSLNEEILMNCQSTSQSSQTANSEINANVAFLVDKILNKGLLSPCKEAMEFSLGLLIRLITTCKQNLGGYQSRLVSVMVECMSAFEPSLLQYMQFHTSKLNITDEALEKTRIEIAAKSPMQEALDGLLKTLEKDSVGEVIRELNFHFSRGVGLPTRVAAAQSLSYLAETYPDEVGKYCATVCQSIAYTLLRGTATTSALQKTMCNTLGSLAKVSNIHISRNIRL